MIPAWQIALLCIFGVEEFSFSFNEEQKIFIDGTKSSTGWIVNVRVITPVFCWGVNRYATKMTGSHQEVVRWFLTLVLNQMAEYQYTAGRTKILSVIKANLD